MKKYFILFIFFCVSACSKDFTRVSVSPDFSKLCPDKYTLLPFNDSFKKFEAKYSLPGASTIMTDAFREALLNSNNKLANPRKVRKVLENFDLDVSYDVKPSKEQLRKIKEITQSDALILGKLVKFQGAQYLNLDNPETPTDCSTIIVKVKAIDMETGELLWTANASRKTGVVGDVLLTCRYDMGKLANKIAADMVWEIMEKVPPKPFVPNPVKQIKPDENK